MEAASPNGISENDFRQLLKDISEWYDQLGYINMLKVLYRDHVIDTNALYSASKMADLLEKLHASGNLSPTDLTILYDTINVTGQFGFKPKNENQLPSFQNVRKISKFTWHRQKLLKIGMALTPDDIAKLDSAYNMPTLKNYKDSWSLIMDLEHKRIIHEKGEKMKLFTDKLNELQLPVAVEAITEGVPVKITLKRKSDSSDSEDQPHQKQPFQLLNSPDQLNQKNPLDLVNELKKCKGNLQLKDSKEVSEICEELAIYFKQIQAFWIALENGSIVFHLSVHNPSALMNLWEIHLSRELMKDLAEILVQEKHQQEFLDEWMTGIDELEYKAALSRLKEKVCDSYHFCIISDNTEWENHLMDDLKQRRPDINGTIMKKWRLSKPETIYKLIEKSRKVIIVFSPKKWTDYSKYAAHSIVLEMLEAKTLGDDKVITVKISEDAEVPPELESFTVTNAWEEHFVDQMLQDLDECERTLNVQRARFSEQTERYNDMKDAMKAVVEAGEPLNSEERNLLSVAYNNVCGARRSAWQIANTLVQTASSESQTQVGKEMRGKIENELNEIYDEVLGLIDKCLEHSDTNKEHGTFFNKMRGDYYGYRLEVAPPEADIYKTLVQKATEAYDMATHASEGLDSTHPVRLGLALNYSAFYFKIMNDRVKACHMAKAAFDGAIADLDSVREDTYKDTTLIMKLLRDNLTLWSTEGETGDGTYEDVPFDLTILFFDDAWQWCEYLFELFQAYDLTQNSEQINVFPTNEVTLGNIKRSLVQIVIISPQCIDSCSTMIEQVTVSTIGLVCGTNDEDIEMLYQRIPSSRSWKLVDTSPKNIVSETMNMIRQPSEDAIKETTYVDMIPNRDDQVDLYLPTEDIVDSGQIHLYERITDASLVDTEETCEAMVPSCTDVPFDLTILFFDDAWQWCEYVFGLFQAFDLTQNSERINVFPTNEVTLGNIKRSLVQLVIISPQCIDSCSTMIEQVTVSTIGLVCGTNDEDIEMLYQRIPSSRSWKLIEPSAWNIVSETMNMVRQASEDVFEKTTYVDIPNRDDQVDLYLPTEDIVDSGQIHLYERITDASLVDTEETCEAMVPSCTATQSYGEKVRIVPRTAHCGRSELIVLLFDDSSSIEGKDNFTVEFDTGSKKTVVPATKVNSYTLSFETPKDQPAGRAQVIIRSNKQHIAQTQFTLESSMDMLANILMECVNPIEFLCKALKISPVDHVNLDSYLSSMSKQIMETDQFRHVFGIGLSTEGESDKEYPTILHFAAKYGLSDLCVAMMSMPCVLQALNLSNCYGKTPPDLAEESGFSELKAVLKSCQEHNIYAPITTQGPDTCVEIDGREGKPSYVSFVPVTHDALPVSESKPDFGSRPSGIASSHSRRRASSRDSSIFEEEDVDSEYRTMDIPFRAIPPEAEVWEGDERSESKTVFESRPSRIPRSFSCGGASSRDSSIFEESESKTDFGSRSSSIASSHSRRRASSRDSSIFEESESKTDFGSRSSSIASSHSRRRASSRDSSIFEESESKPDFGSRPSSIASSHSSRRASSRDSSIFEEEDVDSEYITIGIPFRAIPPEAEVWEGDERSESKTVFESRPSSIPSSFSCGGTSSRDSSIFEESESKPDFGSRPSGISSSHSRRSSRDSSIFEEEDVDSGYRTTGIPFRAIPPEAEVWEGDERMALRLHREPPATSFRGTLPLDLPERSPPPPPRPNRPTLPPRKTKPTD